MRACKWLADCDKCGTRDIFGGFDVSVAIKDALDAGWSFPNDPNDPEKTQELCPKCSAGAKDGG
jgi:hypothetical protein